MIVNWFYDGGDSWIQIVRCSCCRVGDPHPTNSHWLVFWRWGLTFPGRQAFSLSFYTVFSHHSPPKPCVYCTCLIMMRHVPFSPNLYTTEHISRNDLRDLRKWRQMFFPSASWRCRGWVYNNQNQTRVVLTQPLCPTSTPPHDSFTLSNVPREGRTRPWRTCKLARLQGDFGELGIVATRLIHQHRPPCERLRQRHQNIHRWAGCFDAMDLVRAFRVSSGVCCKQPL
jgi:hypothetical protein